MAPFCDEVARLDSAKLGNWLIQKGTEMGERDWKEEQRTVLNRLFDSVFERREASGDEIGADIHRLGTVKQLKTTVEQEAFSVSGVVRR